MVSVFKSKLIFVLSFFVLLSSLSGAQEQSTDLVIDGKKITVIEPDPYMYKDVQVELPRSPDNNSNEFKHTLKAYGRMQIAFMASMAVTEYVYCSRKRIPGIVDNSETPTCWDEMITMMTDPGMFLGVLAMTATSIELNKRGNAALNRVFKDLTSGRAKKLFTVSQTMLTHLAMGAGMINQTIIASSWNAPQMRKCFASMKDKVKEKMKAAGIAEDRSRMKMEMARAGVVDMRVLTRTQRGREIVAQGVDEGHKTVECRDAKEHFFDGEKGTMSEINITILSLMVSSVASGVIISTIKVVGMSVLGANPVGLGMVGSMIVANGMIELIDRFLEPIIRAYYHSRRSKRQLSFAFADLINSVADYEENGKQFIGSYQQAYCENYIAPPMNQGFKTLYEDGADQVDVTTYGCQSWKEKTVYGFGISEALDVYQKKIVYRREGASNRFIETHNRWKEKLANIFTAVKAFQDTTKGIIEIKNDFKAIKEPDLRGYYNQYNILSLVKDPIGIPDLDQDSLKAKNSTLSKEQVEKIYAEFIKPLAELCKQANVNDRNEYLERTLVALHDSFHEWDFNKIRMNMWRLKTFFDTEYISYYHPSGFIDMTANSRNLRGPKLSNEDVIKYKEILTNSVTSLTPQLSFAYLRLEELGVEFISKYGDDESDEDEAPQSPGRKGVALGEKPVTAAVLNLNKDDEFTFSKKIGSPVSKRKNKGLESENVGAKVLSHLVCADKELDFQLFWNNGQASTVIFPNILKNPDLVDCDYESKLSPSRFLPDSDFLYNSATKEVTQYATEEILHRIFSYDGKEKIGLLDVIIDPKAEIKWATVEEFDADWKANIRPKFLRFLLQARQDYYETIHDYLDLFFSRTKCPGGVASARCDNGFVDSGLPLSTEPITQAEIERRLNSSPTNKAYYQTIYTGDTFAEEVRTYSYLVKLLLGDVTQEAADLDAIHQKIISTVSYLDTTERDFRFSISDLSEDDINNRIKALPFPEVLTAEGVQQFTTENQALKAMVAEGKAKYEQFSSLLQTPVENLSNEEAQGIIMYKVYKNLEDSVKGLFDVVLKEYIGGASITHL